MAPSRTVLLPSLSRMTTAPALACATVGSMPSMARPSYSESGAVTVWPMLLALPSSCCITMGSATSPPTLTLSLPSPPMIRVITPTGVPST